MLATLPKRPEITPLSATHPGPPGGDSQHPTLRPSSRQHSTAPPRQSTFPLCTLGDLCVKSFFCFRPSTFDSQLSSPSDHSLCFHTPAHSSKFRISQLLCLPRLRKLPGVWGFFPFWNSLPPDLRLSGFFIGHGSRNTGHAPRFFHTSLLPYLPLRLNAGNASCP